MQTNTILQGDCLELLKTLPSASVDFIFADPPYFMQTEGELLRVGGAKFSGVAAEWDKFKDFAHYDGFSKAWLSECKRVLKGSICVIGSFQNIHRLGALMQDLGFWIINDMIWAKSNPCQILMARVYATPTKPCFGALRTRRPPSPSITKP
ncbi:hypothetical protein NHP21005_14850 [Helicobacter sp. NHP21005]|nr:hypothetical protein NHP21005_14850 [Helicobacter sp. NHP21005]